jgi:uncharacterized protein YbaR (Trm112 family)
MPHTERSSDVIEQHSERAFLFAIGGLLLLVPGIVVLFFQTSGVWLPLAILLILMGTGLIGYGVYCLMKVRSVGGTPVLCPYCSYKNVLTLAPTHDVSCSSCHRMIPILDGQVLKVQQVRCGFCNELNYYSDKTEILLCESCNREIPIAKADGTPSTRRLAPGYAVQDDTRHYELSLVAFSHAKSEELISTLQHMLALNRNQVKQMLTELPIVLLTGITKKKAEMLKAQLEIHDSVADIRALDG